APRKLQASEPPGDGRGRVDGKNTPRPCRVVAARSGCAYLVRFSLPRPRERRPGTGLALDYASAPTRTRSKHALQYTGRSYRGKNGTVVSTPHAAQTTACISRGSRPSRSRRRAARHSGQRWGSFINPFSR